MPPRYPPPDVGSGAVPRATASQGHRGLCCALHCYVVSGEHESPLHNSLASMGLHNYFPEQELVKLVHVGMPDSPLDFHRRCY